MLRIKLNASDEASMLRTNGCADCIGEDINWPEIRDWIWPLDNAKKG